MESGIEAIAAFDDQLRIVYANEALADLLEIPLEYLLGTLAFDLVHPDDLNRAATNVAGVGRGAQPDPGLMRLRQGDGRWHFYQLRPRLLDLPDPPAGPGRLTAVSVRDNTNEDAHWLFLADLVRGEDFHRCIERFTRSLGTQVDGPMAVTYETSGERRFAGNLSAELAWPDPMPGGSPWARALEMGEAAMGLVEDLPEPQRQAAEAIGLEAVVVVPIHDPAHETPACIVQGPHEAVIAEIVMTALARRPHDALSIAFERRDAMARLHRLAMTDPLTGLANRTSFFEVLEALDAAGTCYTICSVDIDRFKQINDSNGHQVGDDILLVCARRLRSAAREGDVVARLGGDEFSVVHIGIGPEGAPEVAARLVAALNEPIEVGGRVFAVGASVGTASARPGVVADDVLAASDAALYAAKHAGRGTWRSAETDAGVDVDVDADA